MAIKITHCKSSWNYKRMARRWSRDLQLGEYQHIKISRENYKKRKDIADVSYRSLNTVARIQKNVSKELC